MQLDPVRLGPLIKLNRNNPWRDPPDRLAWLPDARRVVDLYSFDLPPDRDPPERLPLVFEVGDEGLARVSRARFAGRLIGDPPYPPYDPIEPRPFLVAWDHPPGAPLELLGGGQLGGGQLPLEIAAALMADYLEARALWRMTGLRADPSFYRAIVGWDGVVHLLPHGRALLWTPEPDHAFLFDNLDTDEEPDWTRHAREVFARLFPGARRVLADLPHDDEGELLDGFRYLDRASAEEVGDFLKQLTPEIWAASEALLEELELLERDGPPAARVHPLPVSAGFQAFLGAARRPRSPR